MNDPVDLLASQKKRHNILCTMLEQTAPYCILIFKIGVNQQSHLWLPDKKQYQADPTLEYEIIETSDEKDSLKIFSAGFRMSTGM